MLLTGSAAAGASIAPHPFSARAGGNQAHLRIMETTDIHVAVLPYDYYADRPSNTMGLARTASLIEAVRAEAANAMLVDNGDFLQGNPMGDYIAYERGMKEGDVHPVVKAMNTLDFDCSTLGNHEFNYGLDFMFKVLQGANFPFVCANLTRGKLAANPRDDELFLDPYVILDKTITDGAGNPHAIRVGLIGFLPPQIMIWDAKNLAGRAMARDILQAARAWVPQLREEGADVVVALSHSGIARGTSEGMENASLHLATVDGIDAIMTGHQHLVFPGPQDFHGIEGVDAARGTLHGKPAVMGGFWGSHLGLIDLLLERDGRRWKIVDFTCEARPIYERRGQVAAPLVKNAAKVARSVKADHAATLAYVRTPVGETSAPLYSYFALVADDPSVQIVSNAQLWYVGEMLKESDYKDLPLLSAAAPFKCGGRSGADYYTDVAAGAIAIKNVADLYLYPNMVRAVLIDGAQVKNWLEMSAGIFRHVPAGAKDAELIDADFPSYNFDVIDGVTYEIDVTQPPKYDPDGNLINPGSSRIRNLRFAGRQIDPAQPFVVATNDYRAGGGGNFPEIAGDKVILTAPDTNRDVIVRYIVQQGTINPSADGNWRIAPAPGTSVIFDTGPGGKPFARHVKGVDIRPVGPAPQGFTRFRISL